MCVIIYKPAGVKMPDEDTLRLAQAANPDGCGFATPDGYFKGMDFENILDRLSRVPDEWPCLIHFRLATHGSVNKDNCHPFAEDDLAFMHNGILDIVPIGDMTDSETAFRQVLLPAAKRYGLGSSAMSRVVNRIIGYSKFAFMQGEKVKLYGHFIKCDDGCLYSNLRFKALAGWRVRRVHNVIGY